MVVWGILVVLILTLVLLIGLKDKDFKYIKLERNLKTATRKYVKNNNLTPKLAKSIVIDIKELVDNRYISKESVDEYCIKDVVYSNGLMYDEYVIEKGKCNEE